jgi:membrane-bound serine protease (ClpP class)
MDLLTIAIILFLIGLAVGTAEVFIPSAGLLAVLSVLAFVGSIVCAFKVSAMWGMGFVIAAPVFMAIAIVKGFNILPRTRIGKRMILGAPPDDQTAPESADTGSVTGGGAELIGQVGLAHTELRPSGSAQIGDRRYNVVSAGDFITQGAQVRVIEVCGNRIVVEEVE